MNRFSIHNSQTRGVCPTLLLRGVERVDPHDDVAHVQLDVILLGHDLVHLRPRTALSQVVAVAPAQRNLLYKVIHLL